MVVLGLYKDERDSYVSSLKEIFMFVCTVCYLQNKLASILCIESEYTKHHIRNQTDLNPSETLKQSEEFKQSELILN